MSTIKTNNITGSTVKINTGSSDTTALTIATDQSATFAGMVTAATTTPTVAGHLTPKSYVDSSTRIGASVQFSMAYAPAYSGQWHGFSKSSANTATITVPAGTTWTGVVFKTTSSGVITIGSVSNSPLTGTFDSGTVSGDTALCFLTRTA